MTKKLHSQTSEKPFKIPFYLINLQNHFDQTCNLWVIKSPTIQERLFRTFVFVSALLITIFWPIHDLIIEATILSLVWMMFGLTEKHLPRLLLMLNLMLNLAFLFTLIKLITKT